MSRCNRKPLKCFEQEADFEKTSLAVESGLQAESIHPHGPRRGLQRPSLGGSGHGEKQVNH